MMAWELWDIFNTRRDSVQLLVTTASARSEWAGIANLFRGCIEASGPIGPEVWGMRLPEEFALALLTAFDRKYYLNAPGTDLHGHFPTAGWDVELSAVEAYQRFGGVALAWASENGARLGEVDRAAPRDVVVAPFPLKPGEFNFQSRAEAGLSFDIPEEDYGRTYLWVMDERGLCIARQSYGPRGEELLDHSNLSSTATASGEVLFGPDKRVIMTGIFNNQSRAPREGLFSIPEQDYGKTYLWTIDQRGINIARLSHNPWGREVVWHTNLSARASIAGQVRFTSASAVIVDSRSLRFGRWHPAFEADPDLLASSFKAAQDLWGSEGYSVIPAE